MKKVILTALTLCLSASAAPAQKGRQHLFGSTWTGIIVEANSEKGKLRLRSADEKTPGAFDGVLDEKALVWPRDGRRDSTARVSMRRVTGFLLVPSGGGFEAVWREPFTIAADNAELPAGALSPRIGEAPQGAAQEVSPRPRTFGRAASFGILVA